MKLHYTVLNVTPRQLRILTLLLSVFLGSQHLLSTQVIGASTPPGPPQTGFSSAAAPGQLKFTSRMLAKEARLPIEVHLAVGSHPSSRSEVLWSLEPHADEQLHQFITSVADGQPGMVRGAYVADVFALPVIQQPEGEPLYVAPKDGYLTQYGDPARFGVTGLIAHNYLSGATFYKLEEGMKVHIINGDGTTRAYQVDTIRKFQKVSPADLSSDLIDLQSGDRRTSTQVFQEFYSGGDQVTFQTCLERNGNLSWGLIFVIASPLTN